jgi:hypothetical protein
LPCKSSPHTGAAAGPTFDVVSQRNGNFYTSQAITFPITVTANLCPSVAPMVRRRARTVPAVPRRRASYVLTEIIRSR